VSLSAAIYCRISSDPTGKEAGVTRQEKDCRALVEANGWSVFDVYTDNDQSAYSGKARDNYVRLMSDVRAGHVDAIVAWHPDRLTRVPRELEDLIDLVEARSVQLVTVKTGEHDLSNEHGRMNARLLGTLARYESEHRSARVVRKLEENAAEGRPHGRRAYGWDRVAGPDGLLETKNEAEAAVIQEMAERVLAGESLRAICQALNDGNVPAPGGGTWQRNKARALLLRERNAGWRVHKKQRVGRGRWEPILDDVTFDRVVAVLRDPARRTSSGSAAKHLLSGIARCGVCDGPLRAGGNRGVLSYRCADRSCVSRRAELVDAVVKAAVVARLAMPDIDSLLPKVEHAELRGARDELDRLLGHRTQAGVDLVDGTMTHDQFRGLSVELNRRIQAVEREIERLARAAQVGDLAAALAAPEAVWSEWPLGRRRGLVNALMRVRLLPAGAGARAFDPRTVEITWQQ
jgi:DNA invertase Pin-like site-specific DNA recombinase